MKVLIIRFSSLGDVVLATAAANFIRAARPEAEISFLTKAAYAPLLEGHPAISRVWSHRGADLEMAQTIRAEQFDAVLDLHGKLRSRFFSMISGAAAVRMDNHAWNRRLRVWLKGAALAMPPDVSMRGVIAAAQLLKLEAVDTRPSLSVAEQALGWADRFLADAGFQAGEKLIAISPGAAWATKRWNPGNFAQAMGLLAGPGRRFIFVGDQRDAELAAQIIGFSRKGAEQTIIAAGRTDFCQLAAILKRASVLLCNDSGPMHVAGAVGTPVVALFGPTVEAFGFFPRGAQDVVFQKDLGCRPCSVHGGERCPIKTHACMEKIAPFDVRNAIEGILK